MARGNYGRTLLKINVGRAIEDIVPEGKKRTVRTFFEFLRTLYYLLSLKSPTARNIYELDRIRKIFAKFLVRRMNGFNLNHYLHKSLAHSVEIFQQFGTISLDSTNAAEMQNKVARASFVINV